MFIHLNLKYLAIRAPHNSSSSELNFSLILKETIGDPVAPRAQVSPRTLERWTVNSKAWYVDNCGRNAKALYGMMGLLPKDKVDLYAGWKSKVALFPRSEQYEYRYIINARIENLKNQVEPYASRCEKSESSPSVPPAAFQYTKPPIWWRDEIPNRVQCAVGLPDDYAFRSLDTPPRENTLIRNNSKDEKNSGDNYYVPGAIYRQENREEDNEVQLGRPDAVKVAVSSEGDGPKDAENCDCRRYYTPQRFLLTEVNNHLVENVDDGICPEGSKVFHFTRPDFWGPYYLLPDKSLICNTEEDRDLKKAEVDPVEEPDPRWHLWHDVCDVPRNGVDRKNAMLNLSRPYLHEINTWYSRNKPTKLLPLLVFEGKRPILQSQFSNL